MSAALNRVKVYRLSEDTWLDNGTGLVSFKSSSEKDSGEEPFIVVVDEYDGREIIRTTVSPNARDFERQGDRIIMWKVPDEDDCALSFQDVHSCHNLWMTIVNFAQLEDLSGDASLTENRYGSGSVLNTGGGGASDPSKSSYGSNQQHN